MMGMGLSDWNQAKRMMSELSEQKRCLQKILSSKDFSGSKVYGSYLAYLVEATESGKSLKETTIALEFFGKNADFNPAEDTIVRSHTYNLRKKLESYYHTDGKEDKFRIRIPKGHYEVAFEPHSERQSFKRIATTLRSRNSFYILAIIALALLLVFVWLRLRGVERNLQEYQQIDKTDAIWGEYLKSDLPVLIAIGDHFFFNEHSGTYQNLLALRDGKINSLEDLEAFKSEHPDRHVGPADEPYFPYHSIWSLPPILTLFYSVHQQPILRKASALSPQMLGEYNMIFVGSIKTLYILKHTLAKSRFRFEISPHKITYHPPGTDSVQVFETSTHSTGPNDDLVLAVKLPGPAHNSIFIIASYHSLGAPEIARYLTVPSMRFELENMFRKKFGQVPEYFEVLFRVTGIDKTAYTTEVLVYNSVPPD